MSGSWAMSAALGQALDMAGSTQAEMDFLDLYSCFPCAVSAATQALRIDPVSDKRALTVTGGLPFFGGPGNNYALHAIASLVEKLRATPEAFGLVLANGGWLTKESAGIYSATRPDEFIPAGPAMVATAGISIDPEPDGGTLETYTVMHGQGGPVGAIAFGRTESGARFLATAMPDAIPQLCLDTSQIGARITTETEAEVTTFRFA